MTTELDPIERLSRDIKQAAITLSDDEARFLVDAYYMMQEDRKRSSNQLRSLDAANEPNAILGWFAKQSSTMEQQVQRALDAYTAVHPMGAWMRQIVGIGPVISAGMLAHIDMEPWRCAHTKEPDTARGEINPFYDPKATACNINEPHGDECHREPIHSVGHIWRFAGLDPTRKWEKGQKRPWNATLKTLCWKAGQSFMKFSGRDDCYYGIVYRQRKDYEIARNERGENAAAAAEALPRVSRSTDAYKSLSIGKLPPAQIDARARRYAVKLFLSHLHHEWHKLKFGTEPPLPYPIAYLQHVHFISPPH